MKISNLITLICIVIFSTASIVLWQNGKIEIATGRPCVQEEAPNTGEQKTVLVSVVAREDSAGIIYVWADTIIPEDIKSIDGVVDVYIPIVGLPAFVYIDARYDVHKAAVKLEKLLLAYDVDAPRSRGEW